MIKRFQTCWFSCWHLEELDSVIGNSRLPTWGDEHSLPYVRALIKEVHRWAPIGSLGIPHAITKADVYEGLNIPNGTVIFPNLTALSRDSDRYDDSEIFMPERYIGDDLNAFASAIHPDYKKRDHFHYGFGRRLCQGIFVAEASLFIVVSRTLWGFDIKPLQDELPLNMAAKISKIGFFPEVISIWLRDLQAALSLSQSHFEWASRVEVLCTKRLSGNP